MIALIFLKWAAQWQVKDMPLYSRVCPGDTMMPSCADPNAPSNMNFMFQELMGNGTERSLAEVGAVDPDNCLGIGPSIITTMINLVLAVGQTKKEGAIYGGPSKSTQEGIQIILLAIAGICIPLMLIPKPCIEVSKIKKEHHGDGSHGDDGQIGYQPF